MTRIQFTTTAAATALLRPGHRILLNGQWVEVTERAPLGTTTVTVRPRGVLWRNTVWRVQDLLRPVHRWAARAIAEGR